MKLFEKNTDDYKRYNRNRFEFSDDFESEIRTNSIPISMKIKIIFADVMSIIGTAFTILGLITFFAFLGATGFNSKSVPQNSPQTEGKLISTNGTNTYVNDNRIYEYTYTFDATDGNSYSGKSYTVGYRQYDNNIVTIRYKSDAPETSCIVGMEEAAFPRWIILFVLIFPTVGILLLYFGYKKGIRNIKILEFGKVALGTYKNKMPTNAKINNSTVFKFYFDFVAQDGNTYTATGETHYTHLVEDEQKEPVIYNSVNPSEAVVVDTLPKCVRKFFDDEIQALKQNFNNNQ